MSLQLFWNFNIFCLLSIHMNNIKFTYDKLESVKYGFCMFDIFSQFFSNLFTFLINNTYITFWKCLSRIQHSTSATLARTNKQTNKQTDNNCMMTIGELEWFCRLKLNAVMWK